MTRRIPLGWVVPVLLLGIAAYALAEDLTLTTYYPSPRGVYKELRIGPGTPMPLTKATLHVRNLDLASGLAFRVDDEDDGGLTFERDQTPFVITNDGNVGIGTLAPAPGAALDVNGQIKITGGDPQPGRVLTATNAQGLAQWQSFSGSAPGTIVAWTATYEVVPPPGWTCFQNADCTGQSSPCVKAFDLWDPQNVMTFDTFEPQSLIGQSGTCSAMGADPWKFYTNRSCAPGYQLVIIPGGAYWQPASAISVGIVHYVCVKQ